MQYSPSVKIFFPEEINYPSLPDDLIEVADEDFQAAMTRPHLSSLDVVGGKMVIRAPGSAQLLAQAKAEQASKMTEACRAAMTGGFPSSALGGAHTYPSAATDQANLNACVIASLLSAAKADWRISFWCADPRGHWALINHTAKQIQQVHADWLTAHQGHQARNQQLQAEIAKAKTVEAVQAIAWD